MDATELLADLTRAGIAVEVDADRLIVRPASRLTDADRAAIRATKAELMALLTRAAPAGAADPDHTEPAHAGPEIPPRLRPWRLAHAAIERAHAAAWDDAAIGRFLAQAAALQRRGLDLEDAEDIAETLHLRDIEDDDRHACGECAHLLGHALAGWRCRVPRASGIGPELVREAPGELHRCPAFAPVTRHTFTEAPPRASAHFGDSHDE